MRRATSNRPVTMHTWKFLSTLSLRRATANSQRERQEQHISIHALLAESDLTSVVSSTGTMDFYPRSPCGERLVVVLHIVGGANFYPRSPCGERRYRISARYTKRAISIHALLAESDSSHDRRGRIGQGFLSTLSLRRATFDAMQVVVIIIFLSTLSLRRATGISSIINDVVNYFYPRSPCGERRRRVID